MRFLIFRSIQIGHTTQNEKAPKRVPFFVLLAFGKAGVGFELCDYVTWDGFPPCEPSTRSRLAAKNVLYLEILITNKNYLTACVGIYVHRKCGGILRYLACASAK